MEAFWLITIEDMIIDINILILTHSFSICLIV